MDADDHINKDDRFKHISKDPRFRRMRKDDQKVKIDRRFKRMFADKRFSDQVEIDKRGRPIEKSKDDNLKRYYHMDETDDDAGDTSTEPDFARGEGLESSSSESEDDEEEPDGIDLSQAWGELDHDAETGDNTSRRLAMCNMDWDRIKATDILVLCSSFLPKEGSVDNVAIYPSEFGKERMKEEDFSGPSELRKSGLNEDEEEDAETQQAKLRQYQLNRLKYYYAVITCDSITTAEKIYADLDGHDYESSGSKIDLRFIPDDMTFDEPREVANTLPSADSLYEPEAFVTKALHQSKVECTWDETDRERVRVTRRKFDKEELESLDLKDYLASSSSEDEDDLDGGVVSKEAQIDVYRKLLSDITEKDGIDKKKKLKAGEVQVTFEPGLKAKKEQLVQESINNPETPFEQMMAKKKKKKKSKVPVEDDVPEGIDLNDPYFAEELKEMKDENVQNPKKKKNKKNKNKATAETILKDDPTNTATLSLLLNDEEDSTKKHFDMKKILKKEKKKKKSQDSEGFEVDLHDNRFAALHVDPNFNIDQSNPNYKKTKSSLALLKNSLSKRSNPEVASQSGSVKRKKIQK